MLSFVESKLVGLNSGNTSTHRSNEIRFPIRAPGNEQLSFSLLFLGILSICFGRIEINRYSDARDGLDFDIFVDVDNAFLSDNGVSIVGSCSPGSLLDDDNIQRLHGAFLFPHVAYDGATDYEVDHKHRSEKDYAYQYQRCHVLFRGCT